jgi:hypothetical protein
MKRIAFAAVAFLALSAPASAQYPGWYYGERYYGGRGYDPWYDDDDYRPRRPRRPPPGYDDRRYRGGPPAHGPGRLGTTCVTPAGACRVGVPTPVGTNCGCVRGGVTAHGSVR